LLATKSQPLPKKLLAFVLDAPHAERPTWLWGGEPIVIDGQPVGELSSAGFSIAAGRCIGLGYARGAAAMRTHAGSAASIEVWGEPVAARGWDDMGAALRSLQGM
jgi:4-methylaminobutanoate oxidase (formaldehyde-forming)